MFIVYSAFSSVVLWSLYRFVSGFLVFFDFVGGF